MEYYDKNKMIIKCFCASSLPCMFSFGNLRMTRPPTSSLSFSTTSSSATSEQCTQHNATQSQPFAPLLPMAWQEGPWYRPWSCRLTTASPCHALPASHPFFFFSFSLSLREMHLPLLHALIHARLAYTVRHFLPHCPIFFPFIIPMCQ